MTSKTKVAESKGDDSKDKEIEKLRKDNDNKDKTLTDLTKQMKELQKAFIALQSTSNLNLDEKDNRSVSLSTNFINGISIYSPKKDVDIHLLPFENTDISYSDMKLLLQSNFVKEFLKKGVIYFANKEDYKTFKIYQVADMSDEHIIDVLTNYNQNDVVKEFNSLTGDKHDTPCIHCLFYKIVNLVMENKLNKMQYDIRETIERYFGCKIDTVAHIVNDVKQVRNK